METTIVFPVDPGTVVEVTCTYSEAVNEGSSQVTCRSHTEFSYSDEPSCEISGELIVLLIQHCHFTNNLSAQDQYHIDCSNMLINIA